MDIEQEINDLKEKFDRVESKDIGGNTALTIAALGFFLMVGWIFNSMAGCTASQTESTHKIGAEKVEK